jgi:hypothetical protein
MPFVTDFFRRGPRLEEVEKQDRSEGDDKRSGDQSGRLRGDGIRKKVLEDVDSGAEEDYNQESGQAAEGLSPSSPEVRCASAGSWG